MKHIIPKWTIVATPAALLAMIMTPWAELAQQSPESAPLVMVLLSVGMALVCISMVHWIKAIFGGKS
ncbi:hypothetical protein [Thiothrix lacustris]|uniref:hypothetical protein n=1 Tax=Thiothrix lacustris TaxID=525917 RepID=UPI0027E53016|nr:hypothetical protein [Thiothrix lacustris]WMP17345.1 hypothetical protein RCS87_18450 [Thiothrix lacustris]